ncbi:Arm DNA-binding domain-containing protein [Utexia brackfieldae]|uniref:Arm DNA-binding domain-containing protein n=1 Tax=Utexia brackfieldae TaxID=3074108 RepID=UPI00370D5E3A
MGDFDDLFLFVAKNGTRSWYCRFTWQSKEAKISFGTYPALDLKYTRIIRITL